MTRSEVFEELYQNNYRLILRFCQKRLSDQEVAQELCAECFLLAWKKLDPEHPFTSAWLYQVARNLIGDRYRQDKRDKLLFEQLCAHEEQHVNTLASELAVEALAGLQKNEREVLYLVYWEGFSAKEIGDRLSCTEQAAWKRVSRAKIAFRQSYATLVRSARTHAG